MKSYKYKGYTIQQVVNYNSYLFRNLTEKQQLLKKIWMVKSSKYSEVWYTTTLRAAKKLCT